MFKIREGIKEDCIDIESMIKELAVYQNMAIDSPIDHKIIEREAFGEQRLLRVFVAQHIETKELMGYSLYFFTFSTFSGKGLYLEDLFVRDKYRNLGVGQQLLTTTVKEAALQSCNIVEWKCLDWNHSSINFYKKFGATQLSKGMVDQMIPFILNKQQIQSVVENN